MIARRSLARTRRLRAGIDFGPQLRVGARVEAEAGGYRVTTAENGLEALAALANEVPDLMLLDIQMPGMGGEDVVMTMQQDVPFLIHSTLRDSDPRVVKLMELGALGRVSSQTLLADVARALDE